MAMYADVNFGTDALDRLEKFRTNAMTLTQAWWAEANIDARIEAGDPYVFRSMYGYAYGYENNIISLNRVRPIINMVTGHQRQNRKSIIAIPIEGADQQTADQFTKLFMWANNTAGILETISDCHHSALITGMSLIHVWQDFRSDPVSGDIRVDKCEYDSFIIDPFFRKLDLSDCNGILKRSYITREECESLLPNYREQIINVFDQQDRDGKFSYMPENLSTGRQNLLTYDEFYYRAYRTATIIIDPQSGNTIEWQGKDKELKEYITYFPQLIVKKQKIPTVNMSLVVQGNLIYDGKNQLGIDMYPFIPIVAYYRPDLNDISARLQGMVRGLRDAQFLYNRRKSNENDLLESQINSGIIVKENALVNFDDVFKKDTGQIMVLKETAQMSDVIFKDPPSIPQSTFQLSQSMADETMKISGVNEELLGSAVDDKAGILSQLRQGAGLITLRPLFDNLDRSQKLLGKLLLSVIQNNFTPGKVARIIEEQPTQEFYNKSFGKYDAAIEDGINTTTQKQMQFAQLVYLRETGLPIPDETIIEAATLQNKRELIEKMQQQKQETMQMQNMQLQTQIQMQNAQIEALQAKAKADLGWAFERTSRVPENRAFAIERLAEAEKDRQQALLNMAKTLSEIDSATLNNLQRLVQLSNMLTTQSIPEKIDVATPTPLEQSMFGQVAEDNKEQSQY